MIIEEIKISKTEETPAIVFDHEKSILTIEGRSVMDNPGFFYRELIEWMHRKIIGLKDPIYVNIFLEYFNSGSARYLLEFLMIANQESRKFRVNWFVEENDMVILEKGREFKYLLNIPISIKILDQ